MGRRINVYSHAMKEIKQKKQVHMVADEVGRMLSNFAETPFVVQLGTEVFTARSVDSVMSSLYLSPEMRPSVARMPAQEARDFVRRRFTKSVNTKAVHGEILGESAFVEGSESAPISEEHKAAAQALATSQVVRQTEMPKKIYVGGRTIDTGSKEHLDIIKCIMKARIARVPAVQDALRDAIDCELYFEPAKPTPPDEFYPDPSVLLDEIRREMIL